MDKLEKKRRKLIEEVKHAKDKPVLQKRLTRKIRRLHKQVQARRDLTLSRSMLNANYPNP